MMNEILTNIKTFLTTSLGMTGGGKDGLRERLLRELLKLFFTIAFKNRIYIRINTKPTLKSEANQVMAEIVHKMIKHKIENYNIYDKRAHAYLKTFASDRTAKKILLSDNLSIISNIMKNSGNTSRMVQVLSLKKMSLYHNFKKNWKLSDEDVGLLNEIMRSYAK